MRLLTTNHPFIGEFVDNGTPEDEEKAFAGELPWIYHPSDFSNEVFKGLPLELVALKPLQALFERCFNTGKEEPLSRPNLSEWAEVLEKLSHMLVSCQNQECNASFNFLLDEGKLICPFCESEMNNKQVLYIRNNLQDKSILEFPNTSLNDTYIDTGLHQTLNLGETLIIKNSPPGSIHWAESEELLSICFTKNGLEITPSNAKFFEMGIGQNELKRFNSKTELSVDTRKNKWLIIKPVVDSTDPQIDSLYRLRW